MINENRLIDKFIDMVKIPSPSGNERAVANYILKELKELNLDFYEDNAKEALNTNCGNIIVNIKGNKDRKILLSAHMDTVTPCENVNVIIEDGIIKTDKTTILGADDKAGIAIILEMIRFIKENKIDHPELVIVFSVCEETGLHGAKNIDLSKFDKIDHGYILDAGSNPGICYNRAPYSAKGDLKVIGKEAHAGAEPEKGINALVVASEAITKLQIGRIDEYTTCNLGVVRGGIATNIVMPELEMKFEARSLYEDKLDEVLENVKNIFNEVCKNHNAVFETTVKKGTLGFNIDEDSKTIQLLKKAATNLEFKFKAHPSGGGSDTNIYNMRGIESINIGIGMENVHTKEEYIEIKNMVDTTKLLIEILTVID